jgi:hypothetical protein
MQYVIMDWLVMEQTTDCRSCESGNPEWEWFFVFPNNIERRQPLYITNIRIELGAIKVRSSSTRIEPINCQVNTISLYLN